MGRGFVPSCEADWAVRAGICLRGEKAGAILRVPERIGCGVGDTGAYAPGAEARRLARRLTQIWGEGSQTYKLVCVVIIHLCRSM